MRWLSKVLDIQVWLLEFESSWVWIPRTHMKMPNVAIHSCNPSAGEIGGYATMGLLASQSSLGLNMRHLVSKLLDSVPKSNTQGCSLAFTCMYTHAHAYLHQCDTCPHTPSEKPTIFHSIYLATVLVEVRFFFNGSRGKIKSDKSLQFSFFYLWYMIFFLYGVITLYYIYIKYWIYIFFPNYTKTDDVRCHLEANKS